MKKSLKFQFISLFTSRNFNIILMLSIVFALVPTLFYGIKFHSVDINTIPAAYSFFLGSGYIGIFNKIYYVLMPLIVVIPFADSYYTDCKNHTIYGILSKCTLKQYYYSKLICVFSSGVIVILIPLLKRLWSNTKSIIYGLSQRISTYIFLSSILYKSIFI